MADLDSGHIFFTTLAPIKGTEQGNKDHTSFQQNVRIRLARLPTAMQSPATQDRGEGKNEAPINSPFARNRRTHLARMFVVSDAIYNGRTGENAVVSIFKGTQTIVPQEVDQLNAAYLVFCADIDAITKDGDPLPTNLSVEEQKVVRRAYACELWDTMGLELEQIYSNCIGFDDIAGSKKTGSNEITYSAEGFADYLERCHVETTMPFHDYYLKLPEFHILPVKLLGASVIIPALIALCGLIAWLFGAGSLPLVGWGSLWTFIIGALLAVVAFYVSVKYTLHNGRKPLAPAEYDDLPSVLKSLYTQQTFSEFVIDHQGKSNTDIHQSFGEYLAQHKPQDKNGPTQAAGVISSFPINKDGASQ